MEKLVQLRIRVVPLVGLLLLAVLLAPVPVESGRAPCPQGSGEVVLSVLIDSVLPPVGACPILDLAFIVPGTTDQLMVMNSGQFNMRLHPIYSDRGCTLSYASWSPDGMAVAFRKICAVPPFTRTLWRIDVGEVSGAPQGKNAHQLSAACGECYDPAWSPMGDVIAVGGGGGSGSPPLQIPSIFLVDAITGAVQTFYTGVAGSLVLNSAWSSDGLRLAVVERDGSSGLYSIKIVERSTGNVLRTLIPGVFNIITHIDWARGLEKLAFTFAAWDAAAADAAGCPGATRCIFAVDFTSPSETVTKIVDGNAVAWSPDNTKLAFGGIDGIKTVDLATGTIVTLHPSGDFPDWRR